MLPARMLLDLLKAPGLCMVCYGNVACDTFMENHLSTLDSTFFLKLMPENQDHSGRFYCICTDSVTQDVFTNQIWDS